MRPYAACRASVPLLPGGVLFHPAILAQLPDPPGLVEPGERSTHEAYLFAHMMGGDYWRLYYSLSLDGLHWKLLNRGQRVFEDYRGHADSRQHYDALVRAFGPDSIE